MLQNNKGVTPGYILRKKGHINNGLKSPSGWIFQETVKILKWNFAQNITN